MTYRICMISDCSAPTNPAFPGHGLGQAVHQLATALLQRGHEVTLVAVHDSEFAGHLVMPIGINPPDYEAKLIEAAITIHRSKPFDIFIDNTHSKALTYLFPHLPMLSVYHDIWMQPGAKNAVMVSAGMKALPGMEWAWNAPVVHHVLDGERWQFNPTPQYPPFTLICGIFRDYKNPVLAIEACAKLDIQLAHVGTFPGGLNPFGRYGKTQTKGHRSGGELVTMFQLASVYLQMGDSESFGLTTVQAMLCGTPVVALGLGGSVDLIEHGVSGLFVQSSRNMAQSVADSVERALTLDREMVAATAQRFVDVDAQLDAYEHEIRKVLDG